MKGLSILFILQGLGYLFQSSVDLFEGRILRFVNYPLSPSLYIIGIVLGLSFVIAGTGMWFRKRFAYYLSIFLCSLMSIYIFVAIGFMMIEEANGPVLLVALILFLFLFIARYILRSRSYFE